MNILTTWLTLQAFGVFMCVGFLPSSSAPRGSLYREA